MSAEPAPLPADLLRPAITLTQLFNILRAHAWWIAVWTLGCGLLAGVVSKLVLPRTYDATASLLIDYQVEDPATSNRDFPSMLAASYLATQVDLLQGPKVLLTVVEKLGLARDPDYTKGYTGEAGQGGLNDYVASAVSRNLTVSTYKDSRLVHITYRAKSREAAAQVANTVAQVYLDLHIARVSGPARSRATQYDTQLNSLREKLDAAQAQFSAFREESGQFDFEQKVDMEGQRLLDLNRRLTEAQSEARRADLRLQQLGRDRAAGSGDSDSATLDSELVQDLKNQLIGLRARAAEQAKTLGRNHPNRIALHAQIAEVEERLSREQGMYGSNVQGQSRIAGDNLAQLEAELEAQRETVLETRRIADEGRRYQREVESAQRLYNDALEGYSKVLINSGSNYTNVSIASPATPPFKHSSPKTLVNILLGLVLGAGFGVASAFLREFGSRKVRSREDVERELGLPVLAVIGRAP